MTEPTIVTSITLTGAEYVRLTAENKKLRAALGNCVRLLDELKAESGREIEYGHEDSFRTGEWFEVEDIAQIEAARALLTPAHEKGGE